jgi:hypothetical protein
MAITSFFKWGRVRDLDKLKQDVDACVKDNQWERVVDLIEGAKKVDWPSAGHKKLDGLLIKARQERFLKRVAEIREYINRYFDEGLDRCLDTADAQLAIATVEDHDRSELRNLRIEVDSARDCLEVVQAFDSSLSDGQLELAQRNLRALDGRYPETRLRRLQERYDDQKREGEGAYQSAKEHLQNNNLKRCRESFSRAKKVWADASQAQSLEAHIVAAEGLVEICARAQKTDVLTARLKLWQEAQDYSQTLPSDLLQIYGPTDRSIEDHVTASRELLLADLCRQADQTDLLNDRLALLNRVVELDANHARATARDHLRKVLASLETLLADFNALPVEDLNTQARCITDAQSKTNLQYKPLQDWETLLRERVAKAGADAQALIVDGSLKRAAKKLQAIPNGWGFDPQTHLQKVNADLKQAETYITQASKILNREEGDLDKATVILKNARGLYAQHELLDALDQQLTARKTVVEKVNAAQSKMTPGQFIQAVKLLEEAQNLFDCGQVRSLLEDAREGASTDQKTEQLQSAYQKAAQLYDQGDLEGALSAFDVVLSLDKDHVEAQKARENINALIARANELVEKSYTVATCDLAIDLLKQAQDVWFRHAVDGRVTALEAVDQAAQALTKAQKERDVYVARDLALQAQRQLPSPMPPSLPEVVANLETDMADQIRTFEARIKVMGIRGAFELQMPNGVQTIVLPILAYASGIMVGNATRGQDAQGHNDLSARAPDIDGRAHLKFLFRGNKYWAVDYSRSGTYIDDIKKDANRSFQLEDGHVLRLGKSLCFRITITPTYDCVFTVEPAPPGAPNENLPQTGTRVVLLGNKYEIAQEVYIKYDNAQTHLCIEKDGQTDILPEGELLPNITARALPEEVVI